MRRLVLIAVLLSSVEAYADEICFPTKDARRLLGDLEVGNQCINEYKPAADEIIRLKEERIVQLVDEKNQTEQSLGECEEGAKKAISATKGSWLDRLRHAGGWVGVGVALGIIVMLL